MDYENTSGHPLATPRHRLAAVFVDAGFYIVTLGIGWVIWNLIAWGNGQTPGEQVLKIRVYDATQPNKAANWGRMAIRQALITAAISLPIYILWVSCYFFGTPRMLPRVLVLHISALGAASMYMLLALSLVLHLADALWIFRPGTRRLYDHWAKTYVVNESETVGLHS
jgi:hypothetical protein